MNISNTITLKNITISTFAICTSIITLFIVSTHFVYATSAHIASLPPATSGSFSDFGTGSLTNIPAIPTVPAELTNINMSVTKSATNVTNAKNITNITKDFTKANIPSSPIPSGTHIYKATNCMPPGPNTLWHHGKDGTACHVTGLPNGQVIIGVCMAGQCRATGFTSSQSVLNSFLSGALNSVASQFLGGLMGGGSSADYPSDYPSDYGTGTSTLGDITFNDLGTSTDYGSNGTDLTFNPGDTGSAGVDLKYTSQPAVIITTKDQKPPTITQKLYAPLVKKSRVAKVAVIPGKNELQRDYNKASLYSHTDGIKDTRTIALNDLEKAAAEARAREALRQEKASNTNGLRDYGSSNIGNRNTINVEPIQKEKKKSWWMNIIEYIGHVLGKK